MTTKLIAALAASLIAGSLTLTSAAQAGGCGGGGGGILSQLGREPEPDRSEAGDCRRAAPPGHRRTEGSGRQGCKGRESRRCREDREVGREDRGRDDGDDSPRPRSLWPRRAASASCRPSARRSPSSARSNLITSAARMMSGTPWHSAPQFFVASKYRCRRRQASGGCSPLHAGGASYGFCSVRRIFWSDQAIVGRPSYTIERGRRCSAN